MVVQALGLALSTAEPRWSGIILSLFNPFIHSSFLHPLFSSSPPFISFHPLFLLVTSLIQTRVLSVVLSLYCLLVIGGFFPWCFFFYLFSLLEVVTRSLNLYYFFPLSRLCSNFHRHNGFGIWYRQWSLRRYALFASLTCQLDFLGFGSQGLTRDFSSFHF